MATEARRAEIMGAILVAILEWRKRTGKLKATRTPSKQQNRRERK